jgi:uncharacterized membrane protein YdcZ (DUF606 family)
MLVWFVLAATAMIGALIVDHFGLFGLERRAIGPWRILGTGLLLFGLALILLGPWDHS